MPLHCRHKVDLTDKSTFRLPAEAAAYVELTRAEDAPLLAELSSATGLRPFILGGGSNILFAVPRLERLVCRVAIPGIGIIGDRSAEGALVRFGAGVVWDDAVAWSVEQGLSGIEAMSGIPGTVGATPIQNVGAYGQELKDTFVSLEAYDMSERRFTTLTHADCRFGYRDSIFKHEAAGRYLITSVTLRLSTAAPRANYASLTQELTTRGITSPTVRDIRDAVLAVRATRLPDPALVPSAGSFFTNPIIAEAAFALLKAAHPAIPSFPADPGFVKVPAGWLIEQAGFKGRSIGAVGIYGNNALVLTNNGGATHDAVEMAARTIAEAVYKTFQVTLVREPEEVR
jgi:UDP-N-acetylmuramate dehydrogenase